MANKIETSSKNIKPARINLNHSMIFMIYFIAAEYCTTSFD